MPELGYQNLPCFGMTPYPKNRIWGNHVDCFTQQRRNPAPGRIRKQTDIRIIRSENAQRPDWFVFAIETALRMKGFIED